MLMIIVILFKLVELNFYNLIKNPQNLMNDTNDGVLGGTISGYLELNEELMITFWFKFNGFSNNIFPFLTFYENNNIFQEYNYYKQQKFISSQENYSNSITIEANTLYFLKIEGKLNQGILDLKLYIFKSLNDFSNIDFSKKIKTNINNFVFLINRYNLSENLIIEKLTFYNSIQNYTNKELYEDVSNILFFINFRNNYINTKWFMNEIKNEFGPALNGNSDEYVDRFSGSFNNNTKEVEWFSASVSSEINFNPVILSYINQFELNFSLHIFLKLDFFFNHIQNFGTSKFKYYFFYFYNHKLLWDIDVDTGNKDFSIYFFYIKTEMGSDSNYLWFGDDFTSSKMVNGSKFIDGSYFGLNYIMLNIKKHFNSIFHIDTEFSFKYGSLFGFTFKKYFGGFNIDLNNKLLKLEIKNDLNNRLIIGIFMKEFIIGTGNLVLKNKMFKSENIINPFIVYSNNTVDLERRFNFNDNSTHSTCNKANCSICRKDLNICEYCFINYYLSNGSCILNNDSTKFVNSYSMLKSKEYEKSTYSTISSSSIEHYRIVFNIAPVSSIELFNIYIKLENSTLDNILVYILSRYCQTKFKIFFTKLNFRISVFNIVIPFNSLSCFDTFSIYNYNNISNNNNLVNFDMIINSEGFDCNNQFKDILCEIGCSRNANYFTKFNSTLFYATCNNSSIENFFKNKNWFKYYNNCPFNCKTCSIDVNDLVICNICHDGYFLKNKECILKLFIDCNTSNLNINLGNSEVNLYSCNNLCSYIGNLSNNVYNIIKFYKINNKICNENDNITLKCKNDNYYFNYNLNSCNNCNQNCLNFSCNNCNNTNNFTPCSTGFLLIENKCVKDTSYDQNCSNYFINNNKYACNNCKLNYYILPNDNKCYRRSTVNCIKFLNNSLFCEKCVDTYFLNQISKKCDICDRNCVNCTNNSKYCTSCKFNYLLINNKCIYNKLYSQNCLVLNNLKICTQCLDGYVINSLHICEKCSDNCLTCISNKNKCLSCKNYNVINENFKCVPKIKFCHLLVGNNIYRCKKCYSGYFINELFKCNKCNNNCKNCLISKDNCTECIIKGILLKIKNKNICKYNCKNDNYFFDINNKSCTKCQIKTIKEYKIYENNNINEIKKYNFFTKIKDYQYFITINIPEFLKINYITENNIENSINLKINNKLLNYSLFLDLKYKVILIIPLIVSYKNSLKIDLTINNTIFKNENCKFIKINKILEIKNLNKESFKSDIILKNKANFPVLDSNSTEYKWIKNYYEATKTTTDTILITSLVISFFSPAILTKLSIFLPTLLYFRYLILLNVNFGVNINTVFSFINFNTKVYDWSYYLNLDINIINLRLSKLIFNISKLNNIKTISINNMTLKYLISIFLISVVIIFYLMILLLKFINKIILLFLKRKKKVQVNDMTLRKNRKNDVNNTFYNKLLKKFKIKYIFFKYFYFLNNIYNYLFNFFCGIIVGEFPNLIFIFLIYSTSINILFYDTTSMLINLILLLNYLLIILFFTYNIKVIIDINNDKLYKLNFIKLKFFNPYNFVIKKGLAYYFKLFENIRILFSLMVIFYLDYNLLLQISIILSIQILYLFYIIIILEKKILLISLLIKEIFICIFIFLMIILVIYGTNLKWEIIIFINILLLLVVCVFEFSIIISRKIFQYSVKFIKIISKKFFK